MYSSEEKTPKVKKNETNERNNKPEAPEPNLQFKGKNRKPNITGKEVTLCPECSLPLWLCGYGGDHYNNDTL